MDTIYCFADLSMMAQSLFFPPKMSSVNDNFFWMVPKEIVPFKSCNSSASPKCSPVTTNLLRRVDKVFIVSGGYIFLFNTSARVTLITACNYIGWFGMQFILWAQTQRGLNIPTGVEQYGRVGHRGTDAKRVIKPRQIAWKRPLSPLEETQGCLW